MQNPIQEFRQSSIVFEKPGILSENLRTLTSSNYPVFQFFCWNLAPVSYLPMSTKACVGVFTLFVITQDLNKIKKIPHTLL